MTTTAELTTDLGILRFAPGETLRGRADWLSSSPTESAELCLFYYTEGKGTQDVHIVESQSLPAPGAFAFALPQGPYSFSGRLVSVAWAIELLINPGGHVTRLDFVLSPNAEEIDLHRYAVPPELQPLGKRKILGLNFNR